FVLYLLGVFFVVSSFVQILLLSLHDALPISLNLKSGECFGLIGPNGAGKSTLMKIIVGIINSDSGSVSLHDEKSEHWKNKVGYVPQEITLQDTLTAEQNLATFGALYNLEKKFLQERMKEVLHDIGLYERRKEK